MTIYDIAEKCGVSIATVSRVLNNNPNVRAQTRERVLAVMEAEGFVPSSLARGLSVGASSTVAVVCANMQDPFHTELMDRLDTQLREAGLPHVLCCTGTVPEERRSAFEAMLQQNVAALVVVGASADELEESSALTAAARRVPVILLDAYSDAPGMHCVTGDEKTATAELIDRLVRVHKSRVLFLHDGDSYSCQQKLAGYREGHARHGIPLEESRIVQVGRQLDDINACVKRLLVQGVSFDAVIGSEDFLALGAQKALHRIGLNMPVIGCRNSGMARCCTPELTCVDTGLEAMCAAALDMVKKVLAGEDTPAHIQLPCRLVERESFRI